MNPYAEKLGYKIQNISFQDLLALEDWAFEMIQQPTKAVLFLFPIKKQTELFAKEESERILKDGQNVSENLYFMKQFANNACGTVAVFHAILNNIDENVSEDSFFRKFLDETNKMNYQERGNYFKGNKSLKEKHVQAVHSEDKSGKKTEVKDEVDSHFISFVHKDGHLYELDGRKNFPINHGQTCEETFLSDASAVIKQFMARDPDEIQFNTIVLSKTQ